MTDPIIYDPALHVIVPREPTEKMVSHGQEYAYHEMKQHAEGCFKVMRDQLIKEIEQEQHH